MTQNTQAGGLSAEDLSLLESLRTVSEAYGITITIEGGELVYTRNDQEISREPLSKLSQLSKTIVLEKKDA